MTSPISSNWFYYMTMLSMAQSMPGIQKPENTLVPNSTTGSSYGLFAELLEAAMNGQQTSNTAPALQQANSTQAILESITQPRTESAAPATSETSPTTPPLPPGGDLGFRAVPFLRLEGMLGGKLSGSAQHFINAGKQYNLDPNLLAAIAIHETGNGTSKAAHNKNNIAGMMGRNGLRSYDSVEASIFDMARNLRQNYVDQGRTTVAAIGAKYAPVGAANDPTGLNNHWTSGVTKQMNRLG